MPDSISRQVKKGGAILMGVALYVFVLVFDLVAGIVNILKQQLHLPQLTDFRRYEEAPLHIPVLTNADKKHVDLNGSLSSSGDTITYTIPPLTGDPVEVLLEVSITQSFESSTEIELSLSDIEKKQNETIFLFVHPFNHAPHLQYPANQLWIKLPASRGLEIRCVDVQPEESSDSLRGLSVLILDWR